jgi:enolase
MIIVLDGTENKSKLDAIAILGISLVITEVAGLPYNIILEGI